MSSLTCNIHGPHSPTVELYDGGQGALASIEFGVACIFLRTPADCDAVIKAAVAAKDLLLAAQACGDIAGHTQRACELPHGHEGQHRAGRIVWPRKDEDGPAPLPNGHGENHIDNAGHATHVTGGQRVPGCVTCEDAPKVAR